MNFSGTDGAQIPFWSPDGPLHRIHRAEGKLKRIAANGGPVQSLTDINGIFHGRVERCRNSHLVPRPFGHVERGSGWWNRNAR